MKIGFDTAENGPLKVWDGKAEIAGNLDVGGKITSASSSTVRRSGEMVLRTSAVLLSRYSPFNANNTYIQVGIFGQSGNLLGQQIYPSQLPNSTRQARLFIAWSDNLNQTACRSMWRLVRNGSAVSRRFLQNLK